MYELEKEVPEEEGGERDFPCSKKKKRGAKPHSHTSRLLSASVCVEERKKKKGRKGHILRPSLLYLAVVRRVEARHTCDLARSPRQATTVINCESVHGRRLLFLV